MSDDFEKAQNQLKWLRQQQKRRPPARKLDNILSGYMKGVIRPKKRKAAPIVEAWDAIVPPGLGGVAVERVDKGILVIRLDDASMLYQMEMLKHELLAELRDRCKRIYVKDIRFII
ncbi:Zn-ribbon-containing, putative RNA-binding protein [Limihaloglobus sulfuriphilus]|uniref:Zn-ribbon-containing, putative RNA-binding protein n=1 Tax=Limihaloglobus sulfuriphilus TaxID=1851148 RepID=A0A1R7T609_9BACT|nr:DciA family protein [Limihaloglobus sulfuriphilus]AQQ72113.1 Zn-ribbon-containing, putative RNA-binding protein [Limihaloglobus sulfuriphilus]